MILLRLYITIFFLVILQELNGQTPTNDSVYYGQASPFVIAVKQVDSIKFYVELDSLFEMSDIAYNISPKPGFSMLYYIRKLNDRNTYNERFGKLVIIGDSPVDDRKKKHRRLLD